MKIPRIPLYWLGLLVCVPAALSTSADADLWWHLLSGDLIRSSGELPSTDPWSYTFAGAAWVNHEWLQGLAMSTAFSVAGDHGLLLWRAGWLTIMLAAWFDVVHRRCPVPALAWLLVALPWPLLCQLANLRPQTVTWAMVPVTIALLDRMAAGSRTATWALVVSTCLWVNLHGGFAFGWGLAGLGLLLAALGVEGKPLSAGQRRERLLAAACVGVTPLINVYGLDLIRYVVEEMSVPHLYLPEWNPPVGGVLVLSVLYSVIPLLLGALFRGPTRATAWVGLAIAVVAVSSVAKFAALVMLLGTVCAAEPTLRLWNRFCERRRELEQLVSSRLFLCGTIVFLTAINWTLWPGTAGTVNTDESRYPVAALDWIADSEQPISRIATPLGWGGITLYTLGSETRVSIDGRNTTVYDPEFVRSQVLAWKEGNLEPILRTEPTLILAPARSGAARALLERSEWSSAFSDPTAVVFTRASPVPR